MPTRKESAFRPLELVALQGHASYTIQPRLWLAVDATWYEGGGARVEGGDPVGGVNNARLGVTLSLPAGRHQSFKVAYSAGMVVRTGDRFQNAERRVAMAMADETVVVPRGRRRP